ncbi:MAG TPA: sulfur carrier protein ThiS [Xanthobacteraceae bacterium]|nr:sulfur carrier protein ThiS [Xanthobacteraceae bacterium]
MGVFQGMIRVNGEGAPLTAVTLDALLAQHGVAADGRGVAVAVNGQVVRRDAWQKTKLAAGDDVEIVRVRQGG